MTIKNKAGEVKSEVVILKEYFGQKPEQKLQDFMNEVKSLSEEAKHELVVGAAAELGYTIEQ